MSYCPSCGEECNQSDQYCSTCGNEISLSASHSKPANQNRTVKPFQSISITGTILILSCIGVIISSMQPWIIIEGGEALNNIASTVGANEITPKGSYNGYEFNNGLISLSSSVLLIALIFLRQWDGWNAFGSLILGIGIFTGPILQRLHLDEAYSQAVATRTWDAYPIEMPDGTYAPLGAVEPGSGLIFTFILSIVIMIISAISIATISFRKI